MHQTWRTFSIVIGLMTVLTVSSGGREARAGWQAGTAKVAITPKQPMWMAGYAVADQALRRRGPRPLGQGAGASRTRPAGARC